MITRLSLKNFKAFEDETLELDNLNVLAGLNSSGKSSVIQALRLLREQKPLAWLGPLREYTRNDAGGFLLECRQQIEGEVTMPRFSFEKTDNTSQCEGRIEDIFSYIAADRYGPRNSLHLNIEGGVKTVGCFGENIVDFMSLLDNELLGSRMPEILILNESRGVGINIQEWLRVISPGVEFNYERDAHTDTGRTEFNGHRPVHVGFGLSYVLPIIASVLIHSSQLLSGDATQVLLLIENPEAHLHPSGQTMMGKMLAQAASCGLQIVVETHSDHLLNGIRIAVKEKKLSHTNVKCYFFKSDKGDFPAIVENLSIDKHGMLDYWPDGFFDESEKNLMQLI